MIKTDPFANTPITKVSWREMPEKERLTSIRKILRENERFGIISISSAADNGQVLISLNEQIGKGSARSVVRLCKKTRKEINRS